MITLFLAYVIKSIIMQIWITSAVDIIIHDNVYWDDNNNVIQYLELVINL